MSNDCVRQLPSGWVEARLGELLTILRGISYKKEDATTEPSKGKIPILRATNIGDGLNFADLIYVPQKYVSEDQLLKVGDIIIAASSGSRHIVGKASALTVPWMGSFGAFCYSLRPHFQATAKYLSLFLQTSIYRDYVSGLSAGVNINNLRRAHIEGVPLPVAPLNEQQRIVSKIEELFSELDKGIENIKTAREQLKVYRQVVLKHAFEGKLSEQWREASKHKLETPEQLLTRIRTERERRYQQQLEQWNGVVRNWEVNSKKGKKPTKPRKIRPFTQLQDDVRAMLPDIPASWTWGKVAWMTCSVEYGTSAKSSKSGNMPVIRMGNLQNGEINWDDLVFTSDDEEIEKYSLAYGDVLFNRTNSPELVGKTAIYRGERPALFAGYLIRVNHIQTIVDSHYLNLFLNSSLAKQYGNSVKTDGVNQSNINGEKLNGYPFPYCSLAEQQEIVRVLDEKLSLTDQLLQAIDLELVKSDILRQSILKQAFSGQLVEQNPNDEPASILLERIRAEKTEQEKTHGKIAGEKPGKSLYE